MATTFNDIYVSFLSKITEYDYMKLTDAELADILEPYLMSSIPKFKKCRTSLEFNGATKEFENKLSLSEIEVLATLMVVDSLLPHVNSSKLKKQVMTDKEFRFYSQKNHLDGLIELHKYMKKEAEKLMLDYSFERLGERDD